MSEVLPKHVVEGLERARQARALRPGTWRVEVGGRSFPLLRRWETGFAIEAEEVPAGRGMVDLYEGPRHVGRCLVVAVDCVEGERCYEVKRMTPAAEAAPRDFAPESDPEAPAPEGL